MTGSALQGDGLCIQKGYLKRREFEGGVGSRLALIGGWRICLLCSGSFFSRCVCLGVFLLASWVVFAKIGVHFGVPLGDYGWLLEGLWAFAGLHSLLRPTC